MKDSTNVVVVILVLAVVFMGYQLFLAPDNSGSDSVNKLFNEAMQEEAGNESFRDNFIEGCSEDGDATYKECACMYDSLEDRYGFGFISGWATDVMEGKELTNSQTDKLWTAVMDCI